MKLRPTEIPDEHVLSASAIAGDREAISAIWILHRRWVAAVILAYKPREDDLEDLLQEVAMSLVSKISTVRDPRHVRAWLRTVAINAARASARTRHSRPQLRLVGIPEQEKVEPAIDESIVRDEESRRILSLVANLPDDYREPLMLRALHGMRSKQIAAVLELPEATIDTRISRARRMLRELAREEGKSYGFSTKATEP
ncbi:MAG: RNA polymerase sigma factor [Planctomycetes bacterium]|nr:RNA polymerase sigma factor [Planctomycetota bacterium]